MEKDIFWKNVVQLLKNKKISQEKMCADLGMSIYTLRSSISKQVLPRVDVAKTIADYLGTSVDFLLTGKESNEYKERLENLKNDIERIIKQEGATKYEARDYGLLQVAEGSIQYGSRNKDDDS